MDRGDYGKVCMRKLKQDFYLVDAFRALNIGMREYTFRRGSLHVRLDRFYVSCCLMKWISSVKINYCSVSDHYFLDIHLKPFDENKYRFGPGFWKNNVTVFKDELFNFEMKQLWYRDLSLHTYKDGIWWEGCKEKFMKLIIRHSKRLSESIKKQIKEYERKIFLFSDLAQNSNNPTLYHNMANQIIEELDILIKSKLEGSKVRSMANFIEKHEKSIRQFLNIERRNAKSNIFTEIREGNVTVTKSSDIINAFREFYQDLFSE